jgi:hypothetical protein
MLESEPDTFPKDREAFMVKLEMQMIPLLRWTGYVEGHALVASPTGFRGDFGLPALRTASLDITGAAQHAVTGFRFTLWACDHEVFFSVSE